jgi:hypothetical protein
MHIICVITEISRRISSLECPFESASFSTGVGKGGWLGGIASVAAADPTVLTRRNRNRLIYNEPSTLKYACIKRKETRERINGPYLMGEKPEKEL